jgi:membrane protein insertase Oxa1/YidC/SpoIIIJ
MADLQPKIQEIQEKYKDDPKRLSEETMKIFKTN